MPTRLRKHRKKRGSRTEGYGRVGQHRKNGSKGYKKSGRHKGGWSYVLTYEPDYFGKKGFTSPKSLRRKERVVNVGVLDQMAEHLPVEKREEKAVLDLETLGYTKLLGSGKLTRPLIVKVASYSESAAAKVKEAGGEILAEAQEQGE
jgi:large subunit ribosomal protein L15